ncbi:YceI family protein [Danxiaibacter flavus]|uniref:YceI family protein n=1 Tax=Danxiaibacter flavus TaxID=3049108 RepID=A0ABV3ZBK2_9BACT|nr:YceI family protein [Chitinophagaceae bacterium DXS]
METTKWVVDPMHSEVHFKVKHLVISTVTGAFNTFGGEATANGDDFENAKVAFTLDVNSINTNQEARDNHLRSAEFFDAGQFPTISFESTSFKKAKGDIYAVTGNLTMKGITKEVTIDAEYGGAAKDAWGNTKLGFEVTGKINRKEFGLTYNALTETGGLALGEDIKLIANIQLAKSA